MGLDESLSSLSLTHSLTHARSLPSAHLSCCCHQDTSLSLSHSRVWLACMTSVLCCAAAQLFKRSAQRRVDSPLPMAQPAFAHGSRNPCSPGSSCSPYNPPRGHAAALLQSSVHPSLPHFLMHLLLFLLPHSSQACPLQHPVPASLPTPPLLPQPRACPQQQDRHSTPSA